MQIYNTLTRKLEEFKPLKHGQVTFYHCGPTVYWTQHIGNLRGMTMGDLVRRTFEYLQYKVIQVRNYTDVGHLVSDNDEGEDKMEKGAKREGLSPSSIADKYIAQFEKDTKALNLLKPTHKPRATQYIKPMQEMIEKLLSQGYAYQTELAIYYDISRFDGYSKLSGQELEAQVVGEGKGQVIDKDKRQAQDFALWFFKKGDHAEAIQTWPSPWGEGFPGWHLECSVMSKALLGDTLDLHMGGVEHIPVHHTNEIAQSEAANGVKFVNYWLHNEHLLANDVKMAKSAGTAYSLAEVKAKRYEPLALRYLFLSAHYRSKQNFSWEALAAAAASLKKLQNKIRELKETVKLSAEKIEATDINEHYRGQFIAAIEDDNNIPQALAVLWETLKDDKLTADETLATVFDFDSVLGLELTKVKLDKTAVPKKIQALIDNRQKFRDVGDFAEADKIREKIEQLGYEIKDTPNGVVVNK